MPNRPGYFNQFALSFATGDDLDVVLETNGHALEGFSVAPYRVTRYITIIFRTAHNDVYNLNGLSVSEVYGKRGTLRVIFI